MRHSDQHIRSPQSNPASGPTPLGEKRFQLLQPQTGIGIVDSATQEAELFGNVAAVFSDVLLGALNVIGEEGFHIRGLGKQVRRMTQLRFLDRNAHRKVEDILVAKEVHLPCSARKLLVEERIVSGLPVDLSDVEVAGDAQVPTEAAQKFPLDWLALDAGTDFGQSV